MQSLFTRARKQRVREKQAAKTKNRWARRWSSCCSCSKLSLSLAHSNSDLLSSHPLPLPALVTAAPSRHQGKNFQEGERQDRFSFSSVLALVAFQCLCSLTNQNSLFFPSSLLFSSLLDSRTNRSASPSGLTASRAWICTRQSHGKG
jgi:hypothetical protein